MSESVAYSTQHPHEPEIPPALDAEGRCLVCGLTVEVERLKGELAERDEALRKIAALREGWDSADSTVGFDFTDGFWVAVLTAEEALPESLSARESQDHTQECEDHAFIHHAATGGDADCICPPVTRKGNHDDDTES